MFANDLDKNVVVFGGAGYIGCRLVQMLLDDGYNVRVFDNFLFGRDGIDTIKHKNLEIIQGDVSNVTDVTKVLQEAGTVVYLSDLSGKRFIPMSTESALRDYNYIAALLVALAATEYDINRFVYVSSDAIYGDLTGLIYETDIPQPASLFARLKLRVECKLLALKNAQFHPIILRIANCYGYSPRMRFDLLPNTILRDAMFKKNITIESENSCRAYIHVDDAARAILCSIQMHVNLVSGQIFNIGVSGNEINILSIINTVKQICGDFEINVIKGQPDLLGYKLICKKAEKLLNWTPTITMQDGLHDLHQRLKDIKNPYDEKYVNVKMSDVIVA